MSDPVRKFGPRQRIGGLLILTGGLCGVGGALLTSSDGLRRVAGVEGTAEMSRLPILALFGLGVLLILAGKMLIGRGPGGPT
jgi:hypothetical protein